jgi:hypothetical protein
VVQAKYRRLGILRGVTDIPRWSLWVTGGGRPCPPVDSTVAQGMIKAQRVLAVVALAAGASALASPAASAAAPDHPVQPLTTSGVLDTLTANAVPPEHRADMPSAASQLGGVGRGLNEVHQLHQLTDPVAPVTGLLPAVH